MDKSTFSIEDLIASEKFQKYVLNPDEADQQYWEDYLSQHPEEKESLEKGRRWILALGSKVEGNEALEAYRELSQTIEKRGRVGKVRKFGWRKVAMLAAATISLLLLGYWGIQRLQSPNFIQYQTSFGDTQEYRLADGSIISLNANSQLRLAENWEQENRREVWLEGEGYFEVAHMPNKPFILHTAKGDVEVLGTSFNVHQRDKNLSVTLIEGKVKLDVAEEESLFLNPGEQASLVAGEITLNEIDTEPIVAWKYDRMLFREASIASIISRLKAEFDWDIEVSKAEILNKKVTARVPKNDPEILLSALGELYDLEIQKLSDKKYQIR